MQAATLAEPTSPATDAATPGSSSTPSMSSDILSFLQSTSTSDAVPAAAGALNKCGRRSSVLHGAALPGHKLFSSHLHTSRSLLLAKMSKARRKAYLEYTQQMAEYFAEVCINQIEVGVAHLQIQVSHRVHPVCSCRRPCSSTSSLGPEARSMHRMTTPRSELACASARR